MPDAPVASAEKGRFLVTGLPRCRTAWMAALLTAHGALCTHEIEVTLPGCGSLTEVFAAGYQGVCDPSVYLRYADQMHLFRGRPILVIRRDSAVSKKSLEAFIGGKELTKWNEVEEAFQSFLGRFPNRMEIGFGELDDPVKVGVAVKYLTGLRMNYRTYDLFNALKIEQHFSKALGTLTS